MSLKNKKLEILGKRKIWYSISIVIILAGIVSFFVQGFNLGIDFTSGNYMQLTFEEKVNVTDLRKTVGEFVDQTPSIQEENNANTFIIRTETMSNSTTGKLFDKLEETYGAYTTDRNELVGPTVGKELVRSAILALVIAFVLMLVYITVRFKFLFGVASILTLLHDVAVLLSVFSIFQWEVSSSFIATVLTIIGYSINATIIIFDRVRENQPNYRVEDLHDLINDSVNQTLARSVNTILTVLFALFALFFFGGVTTRLFVLGMIVGIVGGGYSSICLSGSLFYDLTKHFGKDFNKKKVRAKA